MSEETPHVMIMTADIYESHVVIRRRRKCEQCHQNWADLPSLLCPGCEAYLEHQK